MGYKKRLEKIENCIKYDLSHNDGVMLSVCYTEIRWLIERVQESALYVDENSKKNIELNVFLQNRETTKHLGKHVIDAVIGYVQELELQLQATNNAKQRLTQRIIELESSNFVGTAMQLAKQNKQMREQLKLIISDTHCEEHEYVSVRHLIRKRAQGELEESR